MSGARQGDDIVAFAERVLALLDQGSFVATYKYAVLLGLLDLCLEKTERDGAAPESISTRELALKVVELYWPHTAVFAEAGGVLRQNSGRQARILTDVAAFRAALPDPSASLERARRTAPEAFLRMVQSVEWTLILMPLPRLQVVGGRREALLYDIRWSLDIERARASVVRYQKGQPSDFDNLIRFRPNVGDWLVRLNGLLRPLIHRGWAAMVAQMNGLQAAQLEGFLFGLERVALTPVRSALAELQEGRCFYCGERIGSRAEVDHFIPWSRVPDNAIENLVVADARCNGAKRDFLAAPDHLARWAMRNQQRRAELAHIATARAWDSHPGRTLGVARGVYLRLAAGTPLWLGGQDFAEAEPAALREALA